jgi:hypothetical protein
MPNRADALVALGQPEPARDLAAKSVNGKAFPQRPAAISGHDSVTKQGTIIYRVGASALRFGRTITVNCSEAFRDQIVVAAATCYLSLTFDDAELEHRRLQLAGRAATAANKQNIHIARHEMRRRVRLGISEQK